MPTYNSSFTGAEIDGAIQKVIAAGSLASASKVLQKTLTVAGWSSGAQTVSDAAILVSSPGDVKIAQSATAAQFASFATAQLQVTSQTTGSLTITARGTVPTIDIPIIIEVRS